MANSNCVCVCVCVCVFCFRLHPGWKRHTCSLPVKGKEVLCSRSLPPGELLGSPHTHTHTHTHTHQIYTRTHTKHTQVLVVFYNRRQNFEIITVPSYASASDIIEDRDLSVQLDISGIANRALFLKSQDEEHIFTNTESPCDVLFEVDEEGVLVRRPVGRCTTMACTYAVHCT